MIEGPNNSITTAVADSIREKPEQHGPEGLVPSYVLEVQRYPTRSPLDGCLLC
jgi:hypothetical protein